MNEMRDSAIRSAVARQADHIDVPEPVDFEVVQRAGHKRSRARRVGVATSMAAAALIVAGIVQANRPPATDVASYGAAPVASPAVTPPTEVMPSTIPNSPKAKPFGDSVREVLANDKALARLGGASPSGTPTETVLPGGGTTFGVSILAKNGARGSVIVAPMPSTARPETYLPIGRVLAAEELPSGIEAGAIRDNGMTVAVALRANGKLATVLIEPKGTGLKPEDLLDAAVGVLNASR